MQLIDERMQQYEIQKLQDHIKKKKVTKEKEKQRNAAMENARNQSQEKITEMVKSQRLAEQRRIEYEQQQQEQAEFRSELARLNRSRKQQNVERLKRQENYRREQLVSKVNQDARRSKQLEQQKRQLLVQRQKAQIHVERQRRDMMSLFESMRLAGDWKKLSNLNYEELSKSTAHMHNKTGGSRPGSAKSDSMRRARSTPALR